MPLPFEKRWGSDRRKKDEDGKKRDKKKYKTKTEEQMDRQIEELSRQLLEEKHNSRRERLTVTRLQRELTQAKKENAVKDSLMRDLSKERQSRLEAERRLKEALLESETCKLRLESLQEDFGKMQTTMNAVMEYQNNLEQLKQEKNCLVQKYENDLEKCQTRISNLERENTTLSNELRNLEAKVTHDEGIQERTLLVERLKHLEAENNALVLENENQREQYERCLDEVANQVVQALLMQKDLREECLKLHNRVQELEQQNHNLKCVFDSRGVSLTPTSVPKPSFPHTHGSPSSPFHSGGSHLPSSKPFLASSPNQKPSSSRGFDHHYSNGVGMYNSTLESFPMGKMRNGVPSSDNAVFSQTYTSHHQAPSLQSRFRPEILHGNSKVQISAAITTSSQDALVTQTCSMDKQFRMKISPDAPKLATFSQQNGASYAFKQGVRSPQHFPESYRGPSNGHNPSVQTSSYRFTLSSVKTECEKSQNSAWNLISSPSSQQRFARAEYSSRANQKTSVVNGYSSSVMVQPKLNGHQNGEVRNGYVLGDKYSKPYVHAPFHYAQSLLKELHEISSSVKSFESLTLEPKAGKRKADTLHNGDHSRQKLVKGQISLPLESDDSVDSIESEQNEGYATMPELLDTSTSSLSSASVETALERVVSLSPTPLSPTWTDEGDTLEISLDDQILDSSLEQSDHEAANHIKDDVDKFSLQEKAFDDRLANSDDTKKQELSESLQPDSFSTNGQRSNFGKFQFPPMQCQACDKECRQGNWPYKSSQNIWKLKEKEDAISQQNDKTLCNSLKSSPNLDSKVDKLNGINGEQRTEINSNSLSIGNKMQTCTIPCAANIHSFNGEPETSSNDGVGLANCLRTKNPNGASLYPRSPCADTCCPSLICSGPLCTAQKQQIEVEKRLSLDCDKTSPCNGENKDTDKKSPSGKKSPSRTASSAKELAEKVAMSKLNYVTTAEVKLNSGSRERSRTESSIEISPESSSKMAYSVDVIPTTPCVVLRSPVKTKVLLKNPQDISNKEVPCTSKDVEESNIDNADIDESTSNNTELQNSKSASPTEQTSNMEQTSSATSVQKFSHENSIGTFITPSQEQLPLSLANECPKKSISVPDLDEKPVLGVNACWKETVSRTDTSGGTSPAQYVRSRSLGRNENFPLSGFLKEDNIIMKKTRSLDRADSERTPPSRRRAMMDLPELESSPKLPARNKKIPDETEDNKSPIASSKPCQKPCSLNILLDSDSLLSKKKNGIEKSTSDRAVSPRKISDERSSARSMDAISPEESSRMTEELLQFKTNSLGENPFLNSVSMESLQSDNSDDWDSPCKSTGSGKKAATPLSEFLSSDSDSEEENINFVEMWKARETSPLKLPEWNPQKSVEEHRKKMRESLSDSNRSSNLDKSSSLSSSTSSEQWLLNYPFTSPDSPSSPSKKTLSPTKELRFSFDRCLKKSTSGVVLNGGDDDVFIIENRLPSSQSLNKLNSLDRKSTSSGRSSLGENSVLHDFVSSILDEISPEDGSIPPGSPLKGNDRKAKIDKLNQEKSKKNIPNGHCVVDIPWDDSGDDCSKDSKNFAQEQCDIELTPVRTFSMGSNISRSPSRRKIDKEKSDSRTNSPSRIPKAIKPAGMECTTNLIGQSLDKITNDNGDNNLLNFEKEKKKESKIKSRIPQLIRDGFRSALAHAGTSRNKDRFPKVDIIRTARSLPGSPLLNRRLSPSSPKQNSKLRSFSTTAADESKPNGSSSLSPSPKAIHSPHLTKSPRLCASPRMASSPILFSNGFSDSTDSLGGSHVGHSRKSSVASLSSFVVENVPYIDDPESSSAAKISDGKSSKKPSDMQISSPITSAYGIDITEYGFQSKLTQRTNVGLDDQISPEMIEDIKQGRLASNWDSLSLGNQNNKISSDCNLKSAYTWSEDLSKAGISPEEHLVNGNINDDVTSLPPFSATSSPERMECKQEAEAEPCKVQVPLVDGDMMEDFEVEDACGDDDTGSIRENSAQLTERERATLLDSLFQSDDSEDESIPHSDSMSSDQSHPGEREFMRMLGEKNKAIKHQVIRQHSAIYCRVSIMQVDLCHLYTRFGDQEKEALASFDFLRSVEEDRNRGYPDYPMKYSRSHSPHRIHIHDLDGDDSTDDSLNFDPMMQDDTSLTGSSDQDHLASESMILGGLMGDDSFSSSNRHSYTSSDSNNSLSSQN